MSVCDVRVTLLGIKWTEMWSEKKKNTSIAHPALPLPLPLPLSQARLFQPSAADDDRQKQGV